VVGSILILNGQNVATSAPLARTGPPKKIWRGKATRLPRLIGSHLGRDHKMKPELQELYDNVYQLLMSVCISQQLPDIVFVEAAERLAEIFQKETLNG